MTLFTAILLFLGTAEAGNLADEAELNFQLATQAYRAQDYETALLRFMTSNRLSPNRNVTFNIGRTYESLGQFPAAYRWYADAKRAYEADGEDAADVVKRMDNLSSKVALIEVVSEPPGAEVFLDRVELGSVGQTPTTVAMDPGERTIILQLEGHNPFTSEKVSLSAVGQQKRVDAVLRPIVGSIMVKGTEGTTVHLGSPDADVLCKVPCTVDVPVGRQIVYFKRPGFRATPSLVEVTPDSSTTIDADLQAIKGTVVVDADVAGSLIEIDGAPVGYTPAVLSDVRVGSHTLRISRRGYDAYEAAIEVVEDQTLDVGRIILDPVFTVSAASRQAQAVAEAPASVTLIPAEEIRAFGYTSVYEAMAGMRGIFQTDDLSYQSIGVRGFGRAGDYGNRVLVTLDGHTMNDDQIGSSYLGTDFLSDLGDVKQVEVVRGPGSALYGSNAVFGVVNVVTRGREDEHEAHVAVTGSEQLIRGRIGAGAGDEDVGVWASLAGVYGNGRDYYFREYADTPSQGISEDADALNGRTVLAKAWAKDFTLQGAFYGREKEIPTGSFETNLGDHRSTTDDYRAFVEGRYEGGTESTRVTVRAYLDYYHFYGVFPYGAGYLYVDTYDGMWAGVEPRLDQDFGDAATLTIGAETRQFFRSEMVSEEYETLDTGAYNSPLDETPTFEIYSAYGVFDLHPGEVFRLNLGGRLDAYQTSVDDFVTFNPRAALILSPGNEVIKAMGGTAFRAPSPYEYFYNDGGISTVAPDSLDPESVITAELEWTHAYSQVLTTTVAGYYNTIDRLVDTEDLGDVFRYTNIEEPVQSAGVELEARRSWRSRWMLASQASFQRTRVGSLVDGQEFVNSPPWAGAIMGAAPLGPNLQLAQKVRVEASRLTARDVRTEPAALWDVTLTGDIPDLAFSYGVGVRNLLDWRVDHPGGPDVQQNTLRQLGRSFYANGKISF